MKYYVIADPHGFYDEMIKALRESGYFDDQGEHRLVVLGDILDRGSQANEMVEFMMEQDRLGKLIYVLGNHEDLLVDALQHIAKVKEIAMWSNPMFTHYCNGTWDTLLQLSGMDGDYAIEHPLELVRKVLDHDFYRHLLYRAVDYFETPNYVFVHGYIPCDAECLSPSAVISAEYNPNWRDAEPWEWRRARWFNGMEMNHFHKVRIPDKTVLCGHWHTSYGHSVIEGKGEEFGDNADFTPFYGDGIIALDARTKASGIVNCIILED